MADASVGFVRLNWLASLMSVAQRLSQSLPPESEDDIETWVDSWFAMVPKCRTACEANLAASVIGYASLEGFASDTAANHALRLVLCAARKLSLDWNNERNANRQCLTQGGHVRHAKLVCAAKTYIDHHFASPFTLRVLADEVGTSPKTLERAFAETLGTTVFEYSRRVRVQAALAALLTTDLKISCIAQEVGFKTAKPLYQHMKRLTGLTPNQHRERALARDLEGDATLNQSDSGWA